MDHVHWDSGLFSLNPHHRLLKLKLELKPEALSLSQAAFSALWRVELALVKMTVLLPREARDTVGSRKPKWSYVDTLLLDTELLEHLKSGCPRACFGKWGFALMRF